MVENHDTPIVARSAVDLGQAVRRERKRQRISQADLSALAGLPNRSYLSAIEQGLATERVERLFRVLDALGLEIVVRGRNVRRGAGR